MSYNALLYYPEAHPGNTWNTGHPNRSIGQSYSHESNWTGESFPLKKGMGCKTCSSIKALQTELKKRGGDIGVADGFWGEKTDAALVKLGLPTTLDKAAYDGIISGKAPEAVAEVSSVKPKKNWQDTLTSVLDFAKDFQKPKGGAGDGAGSDPGAGDSGSGEKGKSKTWIWVTAGAVVVIIIVIVLIVVLKKKKAE